MCFVIYALVMCCTKRHVHLMEPPFRPCRWRPSLSFKAFRRAKIFSGFLSDKVVQVMSIVDPMFAFRAACMVNEIFIQFLVADGVAHSLIVCSKYVWPFFVSFRVSRGALVLESWKAKELQVLQNQVFPVPALCSGARHSQNWRQPLHPHCIMSKNMLSSPSSDPN